MTFTYYLVLSKNGSLIGRDGYAPPSPFKYLRSAESAARRHNGRVITLEAKPVGVSKQLDYNYSTTSTAGVAEQLKKEFPEAFDGS